MNIDVKRLPSESNIIKVVLYDKVTNLTPDSIFKVVRLRSSLTIQDVILEINPNVESTSYIRTIVNDDIIIEFLDITDKFGTEFMYRLIHTNTIGDIIDNTGYSIISTLPNKVDNFRMVDEKSVFDDNTGIPRVINFQWDSYNTATDNFDVVGFNIYYCIKDRTETEWGAWKKLRGDITYNDTYYAINFIDKHSTEIDIRVPQLLDYNAPKDMKFAIVAVTGGTVPLQSRFSRIETISFKDTIIAVAKAYSELSVVLPEVVDVNPKNTQLSTLGLVVKIPTNAFSDETAILLKRMVYDSKFATFDFVYTYEIRTSNPIESFITVAAYLPMTDDTTYEARFLKDGNWISVPCTYHKEAKTIVFNLKEAGRFVILIRSGSLKVTPRKSLESIFNEYTTKLIERLPSWFKIRKNPAMSNGAYFLDTIGIELQELKFILDYAERQTHIGTADINQADIIYKAKLPNNLLPEQIVVIEVNGQSLEKTEDLTEFLKPDYEGSTSPEVYYNNLYIVDYDKKVVYLRKNYNESKEYPDGAVDVSIFLADGFEPIYTETVPLQIHHVWNFFDEFGMLLNTPRLLGERNKAYKERILDVFKNKSNSSREGLMNGIARELGIRINKIWEDNNQDFIIDEPMVIINKIKINGDVVELKDIWFTSSDQIVIKANPNKYPKDSEVTYVSGLEMHTFNNKKDQVFQNQLYNVNGTATELFRYYVDTIKQKIPIEWGQFKWNEGYWDAGDASVSGVGCLPTIMDADFTGFRPILIDLVGNPKPMSITLDETVQITKYDKRRML